MKNILLSLFAFTLLTISAHTAYAFETAVGITANADLDIGTKEYDESSNTTVKDWSFSSGIIGKVTAVNGSTLTVQSKNNVVYTVTIDNAKIRKGSTAVDSSSIAVGDAVFVQGAVNGTTIVATTVLDAKSERSITQEKETVRPGTIGTVTAVQNNTITILGKDGKTYTVLAADAKIWENKKESTTVSAVATGDTVIVQGSVSGDTITATSIFMVQLPQPNAKAGIRGTVSAITGSTFTLLAADGKIYTVTTTDATVKTETDMSAGLSDIRIGDSVLVKGEVTGTTIDASTIVDARLGHGFFSRFGLFFKNLFR